MRIELQMALDSRDSDIEQLRNLLQSLSVQSLDSTSVNSGPEFDTDDAYTGKSSTNFEFVAVILLNSKIQCGIRKAAPYAENDKV